MKATYDPHVSGSRLVLLSNRLPFTLCRGPRGLERRPATGGLVSSLDPIIRRRRGTWIGWPGIVFEKDESVPEDPDSAYRVAPVSLCDTEVQHYYDGFSNRTLWPLLHSMPGFARFERGDWDTYERVNGRFAEVALENIGDTGIVWVNDYHLVLVPALIRRRAPTHAIAFFLHIPFPPCDVFRICPWDRELLEGLLGCDLIGFHVDRYAQNFLDCCQRLLGARVDRDAMIVEYGDRVTNVGTFPIGADFAQFESWAEEGRPETHPERIVLGVDRLDYTKGIPERIRAFEHLLELHPEHRGHVVLLQIAVPTRPQLAEYRELRREIEDGVARVNEKFATDFWSPIHLRYESVPQRQLAQLYRDADVAMVTPLRDGMNLVAKEFVACRGREPGVLILSSLAGAADTMREAIRVNPYDADASAEMLHRALTMDEEERSSRMAALRRREKRDDGEAWASRFLDASSNRPAGPSPVNEVELEAWLRPWIRNHRLALFVDYDGTLTPLRKHPADAELSEPMRVALKSCASRPDTDVAVVSGRSLDDVRVMVGEPDLIYAGNHGLEMHGPALEGFHHEKLAQYRQQIEEITTALRHMERDGAWTEHKGPTLTFHVRALPPTDREPLLNEARAVITAHGYWARDAHAAVEARPPITWNKGRAVLHILRTLYGPSWSEGVRVVYVGDDETDEDAFCLLAGLAATFRVGRTEAMTRALHRLPNTEAVRTLISWLGRRTC